MNSSHRQINKTASEKWGIRSKFILFIPSHFLLLTSYSLLFISCFLFLTSHFVFAVTPEPPVVPQNYVVDLAGIIRDDVKMQLNAYLRELEQKTTAQMVILTIKSLDGESIEDFSIRTAEKWKLGQKGKDNGVLITIALNDKKYRLEIGYGLEEILPDSMVGSIGRDYLVPHFRKGDYSAGILNAALVIIGTISKKEGVEITGMPKASKKIHKRSFYDSKWFNYIAFAFIFIPLIPFILFRFRLGRRASGFKRGGMWWGSGGLGGGFGGGGFDGFGGGGGGDFGGGGASGDW
ncbi:MAG: hypothetical protein C0415_01215 [Thermodesulfovibrio sp.]|nr:hypothetical protein [Thermodesulfovibrio sp.]